jgi:hypothetical protein
MKKILIVLLVLLVLCGLCGVGLYFGYSKLMSNFTQELGIAYSDSDATNFLFNNGLLATNTCPTGTKCSETLATYVGTKDLDVTLTNEEGTALINQWVTLSKNAPFKNAQMRVNSDGTVDFMGTVDMNRVVNFGVASNIPVEIMETVKSFVSPLGETFPISAKGTLTITDNAVNANFTSIKSGFIPVPESMYSEQKSNIDSFIEDRLNVVPGLSIKELSFSEGKTHFVGTVPQTIVYVK